MANVFPDNDGSEHETVRPGVCEGLPAARESREPEYPNFDIHNPSRGLSAVGSTEAGSTAALVSSPVSPDDVEITGLATDAHGEQDYYPEGHPLEDLGPDALETVLAIENGLQGTLDAIEQLNPLVDILNSLDDYEEFHANCEYIKSVLDSVGPDSVQLLEYA